MTAYTVQTQESAVPWWLVLIDGIAMLILGLLLVSAPGQTAIVTVQVLGLYWLVAGILKIVNLFVDRTMWAWKLLAGIIAILAGIAVLQHPLWGTLVAGSTIILILGFQGLIFGVIGVVQALRGGGWAMGIMAVVSILFGVLLLANVWVATFSLPWVIGVLAIVGGAVGIINAFRLR
jgi:uncharacterized membrane protein HdeD (DUF308 family)